MRRDNTTVGCPYFFFETWHTNPCAPFTIVYFIENYSFRGASYTSNYITLKDYRRILFTFKLTRLAPRCHFNDQYLHELIFELLLNYMASNIKWMSVPLNLNGSSIAGWVTRPFYNISSRTASIFTGTTIDFGSTLRELKPRLKPTGTSFW